MKCSFHIIIKHRGISDLDHQKCYILETQASTSKAWSGQGRSPMMQHFSILLGVSYGHQKMTFRVIVPYFLRFSFISSHFAKKLVLLPNSVSHWCMNYLCRNFRIRNMDSIKHLFCYLISSFCFF